MLSNFVAHLRDLRLHVRRLQNPLLSLLAPRVTSGTFTKKSWVITPILYSPFGAAAPVPGNPESGPRTIPLGLLTRCPGTQKVALGEGPWAAQEAGSLDRGRVRYVLRCHVWLQSPFMYI